MGENILKITDINGNEKNVEILASITLESNGKNYVVYTENKETNLGNIQVFVAELKENDNSVSLLAINDENVWNEIKRKISQVLKGV